MAALGSSEVLSEDVAVGLWLCEPAVSGLHPSSAPFQKHSPGLMTPSLLASYFVRITVMKQWS